MPTITNSTWFSKQNDLFIPLATQSPAGYANLDTPDSVAMINALCDQVERDLLLNALGLTLYNELQAALPDLNAADQKWIDLVNGTEYDGKVWEGLAHDKSFIAYAVYGQFLTQNADYLTPIGVVKPEAENAKRATPTYKIAAASQEFARKYQGGYLSAPNVYRFQGGEFTDYFGQGQDVNVSLYRYLTDKAADFGWDVNFRVYDVKNTFGI